MNTQKSRSLYVMISGMMFIVLGNLISTHAQLAQRFNETVTQLTDHYFTHRSAFGRLILMLSRWPVVELGFLLLVGVLMIHHERGLALWLVLTAGIGQMMCWLIQLGVAGTGIMSTQTVPQTINFPAPHLFTVSLFVYLVYLVERVTQHHSGRLMNACLLLLVLVTGLVELSQTQSSLIGELGGVVFCYFWIQASEWGYVWIVKQRRTV